MDNIETKKAKGAVIRLRVKWQQVDDRCSEKFFRSVRPKNIQAVILELKEQHGRSFTKEGGS